MVVWAYSVEPCLDQFRIRFPDYHCDDHCLRQKIRRTLERIQETGSVVKSKSSVGHQLLKTLWKISAKELKIIIKKFLCGDWHFSLNPLICSSALVCFSDRSYVHLVTLSSSRVLSSGPDESCFF
jgi:hypothetical protein